MLAALLGLLASGCVDKTPPPLWPSPPPPPMATPIGVPERPAGLAQGAGEVEEPAPSEAAEAVEAAPESADAPESGAAQPGPMGPWQPGQANR